MKYRVIFSRKAKTQLTSLFRYLSKASSPRIPILYTQDITLACLNLATFPQRGTERPEIRPGVRSIGFRRRVTITFRVSTNDVLVLGIFYGGQNFEAHSVEENSK
jgi:toxin ParE1/3/4